MKSFSRLRLFLWLSLLLAVTDGLFVWINYRANQDDFVFQMEQRAAFQRSLFEAELANTALRMQQTASYIATTPSVQDIFQAGRLAAAAENGDGPRTRAARAELLDLVSGPWRQLSRDYDTRQLHFQYGDNAISFLRVHAPDRYGDPLDEVRFTIRDALRRKEPTLGFECGRVVCGIRGVVPVFQRPGPAGKGAFTGVLEAGTSFQKLLELLEKTTRGHFAVLLNDAHMEETFWPEYLAEQRRKNPPVSGFFIEASLHPEIREFLRHPEIVGMLRQYRTGWHEITDRRLAFTAFPLRDYAGQTDPGRAPVGSVLVWYDIGPELAQQASLLRSNILYALGTFILIELLLFLALRVVTRRLERVIAGQTETLRQVAIHDHLTGLFNRHHMHEMLEKEWRRGRRHGHAMTLAMVDIDHFKRINDEHGHLTGDRVLQEAAALMRGRLRVSDLVFRYGGEEFLIAFLDSPAADAETVCEALRRAIEAAGIAGLPPGAVTASFGLAGDDASLATVEGLIGRADEALYRAKLDGRNRVARAGAEA